MAKHMLSDTKIRSAKPRAKPFKMADGGGLFLLVQPSGSRLWRYRYWLDGKEQVFAIGAYPELSLSAARAAAEEARALAREGKSPTQARDDERRRNADAREAARLAEESSFARVAAAWLEHGRAKPRSGKRLAGEGWVPKTWANKKSRLEAYLLPALGSRSVAEITPRDLRPIVVAREAAGPWAALYVRSDLSQIFDYALARGLCEVNPAAPIKPTKKQSPESKAPLSLAQIRVFYSRLLAYRGFPETDACLRWIALVGCRPGEAADLEWSELRTREDGPPRGDEWADVATEWEALEPGELVWCRPAAKMKARRAHVFVLPPQARAVLEAMRRIRGGEAYVFPDRSRKTYLTTERLRYAMREFSLGARTTPHCWRATLSTWANRSGFRTDAIERQLAHVEANKVRAAYNRSVLFAERRALMGAWGAYLAAAEAPAAQAMPPA